VAVAFEEATANQVGEESQAGLESVGHEDAPNDDVIFSNEDMCLIVAQDLYSEECKRSHHLQK
jgi:hypothetical protein